MPLIDPITATAAFIAVAVIGFALCALADERAARREQDTDQ